MSPFDALAEFDTPTVANAMESLGISPRPSMGPRVRALSVARPAVGVAVTATMKELWGGKFAHIEPWLRFLGEIEANPLPCVAVFHDECGAAGRDAMIGEGMARLMRLASAVGVICDGAVRDVRALRELDLPVWAGGVVADRRSIRFHRYQVPVEIDGMQVNPGDLIHADQNGAVMVPRDRAAEVAAAAAEVNAKEARLFEMFAQPGFRVSICTSSTRGRSRKTSAANSSAAQTSHCRLSSTMRVMRSREASSSG